MPCVRINRGLLVGFLTCLSIPVPAALAVSQVITTIRYPTKAVVVQNRPNAIAVLFPEKVGLWLDKRGPIVGGIRRITAGHHEILGLAAGGTATPYVSLITGGGIRPARHWAAYLRQRGNTVMTKAPFPSRGAVRMANVPLKGRYLGWKREGKWTCIRVGLQRGTVEWLIRATKARIGHALYRGIKWKLRLRGVGKVVSVGSSEPFAVQAGDWHFTQGWGFLDQVRLGITGSYQLNNPSWGIEHRYFSGRAPFFFAAGPQGATISYFAKVVPALEQEHQAGNRLIVNLQIPVRPVKGRKIIETPALTWLFSRGDFSSKWTALNEWTSVFDFTGHYYRSLMGIKSVEPLPTLWLEPSRHPLKYSNIALTLMRKLHQAAKIGIKVIFFYPLDSDATKPAPDFLIGSNSSGRSACAIRRTKIDPVWNRNGGFKRLIDAAHRLGIEMVMWSASGDLSSSSPLLRKHPDWVAWYAGGTPLDCGFSDVVGVNFRNGYLNHVIRQYRQIRRTTDLDGVWQDSFLTFGVLTDFAAKHPYPRLNRMVKMIREEQAMGLYVMIEGDGPFGLSSSIWGYSSRSFLDKEYGDYYTCNTSLLPPEPHNYYRTLASKGAVAFPSHIHHFLSVFNQLPPAARRFIIAANHDYMAVLPYMKQRRLIGKGKKWLGVEWLDGGKPQVLFAFTPMPWKVPADAKIRDVTTGIDHIAIPGAPGFLAKAWHTYLLIK